MPVLLQNDGIVLPPLLMLLLCLIAQVFDATTKTPHYDLQRKQLNVGNTLTAISCAVCLFILLSRFLAVQFFVPELLLPELSSL